MAKRRLVATLSLAELRPLVHQGTMAITAYQQITSLLAARLPAHAELFAEPVADAAMSRIDWYSRHDGEMLRLDQLPPEAAVTVRRQLDAAFAEISALADQLAKSGDRHREAVGGILRCALVCSPDGVYLVGGKPVCTGWGCAPSQLRGEATTLTRFVQPDTGAIEVQSITRHGAVPAARSVVAAGEAAVAAGMVAPPAPGAMASARRPWPLWPLWLLLGFLVITLLVFSMFWLLRWFPDHSQALAAERSREMLLRDELNRVHAEFANRRGACAVPDSIDRRRAEAGGKTGVVTVSLVWNSTDDLDLILVSPQDEVVYYKRRQSTSRGELDVDANFDRMMERPIENVVWTETAPRGTYHVIVEHSGSRVGVPPQTTPFQVSVTVAGQTQTHQGTVSYVKQRPNDRYTAAKLRALKQGDSPVMWGVTSFDY